MMGYEEKGAPAAGLNIARALRVCRAYRGMPQQDLAAKAGVSPSFVSLIESEQRVPSEEVLARLAAALGFDTSVLLTVAQPEWRPDRCQNG